MMSWCHADNSLISANLCKWVLLPLPVSDGRAVFRSDVAHNAPSKRQCGCADDSVTVTKLQVGLLGDARRLQKQLDRIAGRADTNTPSGLHYILQGQHGSSHFACPPTLCSRDGLSL